MIDTPDVYVLAGLPITVHFIIGGTEAQVTICPPGRVHLKDLLKNVEIANQPPKSQISGAKLMPLSNIRIVCSEPLKK